LVLVGVDVGARFEAMLSDGSRVVSSGYPTLTLRQHIISELFAPTPTAIVRPIDRICIVSSDGVVEECTTGLDWSFSFYHINVIVIIVSGSVTVNASYTVGYFRAKAGDIVYFESAVYPAFDVKVGQTVSITMTVYASIRYRFNVDGGLPSDIGAFSMEFMYLLYTALSGRRPRDGYLTLERVDWVDEGFNILLSRELVRSYTADVTSGIAFHDFANFTASGNLKYVFVQCSGSPECIIFNFPTAVGVTTADRARFSISIKVGCWPSLSDSVSIDLSDVWSYGVSRVLSLSDGVGLGLVDGWSYGVALNLGLGDSVGLGLSDSWGYGVGFGYGLDDSVGLSLSDGWVVWMDEIQLISFAGFGVSYPAIVDVVDLVVSGVGVSYPATVDLVDLVAVGVSVSYLAVVDTVDLVAGASVSVE
jgi:hypothetical protein